MKRKMAVLFFAMLGSSLLFGQVDLENGLVGWYSFDDIQDSVVVNKSSAENKSPDGILVDEQVGAEPAEIVDGVSANAILFSSQNAAHVSLGVYDPSVETDQLAISCWIEWGGVDGGWHGIAGLRDDWDPATIGWSMVTDASSGGLQFETNTVDYGKVYIITPEPPPVQEWLHVVLNFDGSYATYYFNSESVIYGEMLFGAGRSTSTFRIGAASDAGGASFNGKIDEFRIYDRLLTEDEIKFLYNNPDGTTDVVDVHTNLPKEYAIENYPNPFNPTTKIDYQIMNSSDVTLRVVNSLGQIVRMLVDNEFKDAGQHEVFWDGKDSSGRNMGSNIYYVTLTAGPVFESKKIVLLR